MQGYVLMLNGWAVAWKSKSQQLVAMSTAEAEYIAASLMLQELIYMHQLLDTLGFPQPGPSDIFEDNHTVIASHSQVLQTSLKTTTLSSMAFSHGGVGQCWAEGVCCIVFSPCLDAVPV